MNIYNLVVASLAVVCSCVSAYIAYLTNKSIRKQKKREDEEKKDILGRYHEFEIQKKDEALINSAGWLKVDGHAVFCSKNLEFCSERCYMFEYVLHGRSKPDRIGLEFKCPFFPYIYEIEHLEDERKGKASK